MSQADVAIELQYLLWMIGIVFAANLALGLLQPIARRAAAALIQATAFTGVGLLATIRPHETDGQTAMGIPLIWLPFFAVCWLGLAISSKLMSRTS